MVGIVPETFAGDGPDHFPVFPAIVFTENAFLDIISWAGIIEKSTNVDLFDLVFLRF